jgi:signal transduction histidine kinase
MMLTKNIYSRFNLLSLFSISSFVSIFAITSVSALVFFTFLKTNLLKRDISVTSEFIQSIAQIKNPEPYFNGSNLPNDKRTLEEFFLHITLIPDVIRATVYNKNQTIIWSDDNNIIGKTFTDNEELTLALTGTRIFKLEQINEHKKQEHSFLPSDVSSFVESYIPVWGMKGKKVIGVIELYKTPRALFETLDQGKLLVVIVSLFGGSVLYLILFWIVRRGSLTIISQRTELQTQITRLSTLLKNNKALKKRVQQASNRAAEVNEYYLRRIGAELHDGPAQSIGFALLRLDAVTEQSAEKDTIDSNNEVNRIRTALLDALQEIRSLSSGLSIPELKELSPKEAILKAVKNHQKRTEVQALVTLKTLPDKMDMPFKICIYRFVQEGLNNAFHHASTCEPSVNVSYIKNNLTISVSDNGPGFVVNNEKNLDNNRLGLAGLRERVESLGDTFSLISKKNDGVEIIAVLHVD